MNPRILIGLCSVLLSSLAQAGDSLSGRLFFTAAERRELDRAARSSHVEEESNSAQPLGQLVNGMVWRRDKVVAVWIDGVRSAATRFDAPEDGGAGASALGESAGEGDCGLELRTDRPRAALSATQLSRHPGIPPRTMAPPP